MFSKRLSRQLKKVFGENFESLLENWTELGFGGNDEKADLSQLPPLVAKIPHLLRSIDAAYSQLEERADLTSKSLDLSSQELADNNSNLFRLNRDFTALLDSLEQGFLMFDREGNIRPVFSGACEKLLEMNPKGKNITDVLRIPDKERASFLGWVDLLFREIPSFEDLTEIGPKRYDHTRGAVIDISFRPVRGRSGEIESVVLIAVDHTETEKAKAEAAKTLEYANLVSRVLREKSQFASFLKYADEVIGALESFALGPKFSMEDLLLVKHHLHTLKGTAGSFGFVSVAEAIHRTESVLVSQDDLQSTQRSLAAMVEEVKRIYYSMINGNPEIFQGLTSHGDTIREISLTELQGFAYEIAHAGLNELHEKFQSQFIGVSAAKIFRRFESDLRDACSKMGKPMPEYRVNAGELRLIPEEIENVLNLLVHVVRNSAVHGIETAEERQKAGKSATPTVTFDISAELKNEQSWMRIVISDDGRGIDLNAIRLRMETLGRGDQLDKMSVDELQNCIFEDGLSTQDHVSELAGRGVGLGALRHTVAAMGGSVRVKSKWGQGTSFHIVFPVYSVVNVNGKLNSAA